MRILSAVEGSFLCLLADSELVVNNLSAEAKARGLSSDRLIFVSRIEYQDYLSRFSLFDLFLDTFPYNAGATASDALWAGLPVLTCMGESFASRVAGSLLNAIDLPELITHSQQAYEAKAIELASNPIQLQAIKDKLAANKLTQPLFDTKLFTKHLEAAYTSMLQRHQSGLPPDHIYINP
jgi:predicted O-linked N-acetylglucosamine transferase (SPINDLY family)